MYPFRSIKRWSHVTPSKAKPSHPLLAARGCETFFTSRLAPANHGIIYYGSHEIDFTHNLFASPANGGYLLLLLRKG